jgi:hypothetical protein
VAGHQPPQTPAAGPLRPLAPRDPPAGPLWPSTAGPQRSKPEERPPVGVRKPKFPTNKNNDKIYQMKQ